MIEQAAEESRKSGQGDIVEFEVKLKDISHVKVKNFMEKTSPVHVVSLTTEDANKGDVQYFLEFDSPEVRDDWGNGLRSVHHAHQWMNRKNDSKKSDERKYHMIKAVNLLLPLDGQIVSMEIESAAGKKDKLVIEDNPAKYDSATCKQKTEDFIQNNFIVPAEGASLYRFIRSLVSRLLMERETNTILAEIDKHRFNKICEAKFGTATKANMNEVRNLLHEAEEALRNLSDALPARIGKHGPASQLLIDIMLRSIEKTKIYNRMAFAVNFGESVEF
jgi:hypothetical protein